MGYKLSKQYHLLNVSEKSIELEEYPPASKKYFSLSELASQCQKLIVLGFPLEAYTLIEENSLDTSLIYLPLHCQEFLELISKLKFIDALMFAQKFLAKHKDSSFILQIKTESIEISVKDLMGLLCYEDPQNSVLAYMLEPSLRYAFATFTLSVINPPATDRRICCYLKCCKKRNR